MDDNIITGNFNYDYHDNQNIAHPYYTILYYTPPVGCVPVASHYLNICMYVQYNHLNKISPYSNSNFHSPINMTCCTEKCSIKHMLFKMAWCSGN